MNLDHLSDADLRKILEGLKAYSTLSTTRKLDYFEPYVKQREFFANGAKTDERALIAANQVGKTFTGGYEDAAHLTGEYPPWWPGHRFTHPVKMWVCGPKSDKVRDTTQAMLFGPWNKPDEFGTGFIPRDAIVGRPSLAHGVPGAFDTATIKWKDRGRLDESARSTLVFKSYTEEVLAFASDTIDVAHLDEECKAEIYSETRVRLQVRRGISYATLTPLLGLTPFILRFMGEDGRPPVGLTTNMGIFDACKGHDPSNPDLGHYLREDAEKIIAGYPLHERDARAYGIPKLGEGKVFLVDESLFTIDPPMILPHWPRLWGIDFGIDHPFAAALIALDRENDVIYLTDVLKMSGETKLQHVPRMRSIAPGFPVAWPHDGHVRDKGSGEALADQYRNPMPGMPGLIMLDTHSTWEDGSMSTEAAILELDDRIRTGRFRCSRTCEPFLAEYRQYHRAKGQLVKENDDVLSALFKALMMKRYARVARLEQRLYARRAPAVAEGTNFDLHTGQPWQ